METSVIYTCIVNHYDILRQPLVVSDHYDYICFSNDWAEGTQIGSWMIKKIPFQSEDNATLSRYVKILPHLMLKEYEYSIWIDANLQITEKEFYDKIENKINEKCLIAQVEHKDRNCIYQELEACYWFGLISIFQYVKIWVNLRLNHMPYHFGLYENNIIFRNHNNLKVCEIDEKWWSMFLKYSNRDQLCLSFIYFKTSFIPTLFLGEGENSHNVSYIKYYNHNCGKAVVFKRNILTEAIYKIIRKLDSFN